MRANEFIIESLTNTEVDEGVKDWVMAAGIGAMALGGGSALYDRYAQQEPSKQAISQPIKQAPLPAKTLKPLEKILAVTAQKAGITGTELKQFLAQCAHETMDFTTLSEVGDNKYFAKKYDKKFNPVKAKTLGNIRPGDGVMYKGRGYIQLTGRYNYAKAGEALNLPLEKNPALAERPDVAAKVAVWFWQQRVQPKVDDFASVPKSTKPINPALKGLQSRQDHFNKYAQVSIPAQPNKVARKA